MIEATGLHKSFRVGKQSVEAVRGVDLAVTDREIFGLLGPNGAGKTTLMRILTTLLKPDGGQASIAGVDLLRSPHLVRHRIGFVAQGQWTWSSLTAREELIMQARLYGMSKAEAQRRAGKVIEAFGMTGFADRVCRTYSGGQRRRVDIALGIVHSPSVVFFDEPTTGLDPQSRAHLWEEVRRLRAEGTTVFITTHYLEEADALCDRIAIIDHGRVVALGTPEELKRGIAGDLVTLGIDGDVQKARELLSREIGVRQADADGQVLRLVVAQGAATAPHLLRVLYDAGIALTRIEVHQPSLDDVFLTKTGRSLRDTPGEGE
jgi:ABC-2 type transport system ATP-binding protein